MRFFSEQFSGPKVVSQADEFGVRDRRLRSHMARCTQSMICSVEELLTRLCDLIGKDRAPSTKRCATLQLVSEKRGRCTPLAM
jgi:hypothetical protein